jgi:hypothetical protein
MALLHLCICLLSPGDITLAYSKETGLRKRSLNFSNWPVILPAVAG